MGNYKIGIYVRESRDDNEENYETIETQRDLLVDYVIKNNLGKIQSIYVDDNVSGSAFDREGLEMLKNDVLLCNINLLIVKDLSRLGRNNAKTLMFLDFLEENGVRLLTYDGRYDSERDNDTVGIDTWYNERYIRDISRKIRASMRFKIERGEYIGSAPYGYTKSQEQKNRLVVNHSEAQVVKEIYRMYMQGFGYSYIAKHLNSKAYETPSPSRIWNPTAVKRILCNVVYTGDTVQGVSEKVSFKSKKTRRLPMDRWITTKGTHEAIISRDEFEKVQEIRRGKAGTAGTHKGQLHMLKGIMFCGNCGKSMFARKRKNRPIGYICSKYAKEGSSACTSHYIDEGCIKKVLINEISEMLNRDQVKEDLSEMLKKEYNRTSGSRNEIQRLEQILINKQRQQDILYMDKLEGKISEQLFTRMNSGIENRIMQLSREIEHKRSIAEECVDCDAVLESFLEHIKENGLTNEMVKVMVEKITVYEYNENPEGCELTDIQQELESNKTVAVIEYFF